MDNNRKSDLYEKCDQMPREKLVNVANKELAEAISSGFDLLPLYENSIFEHNFKEHYSLQRNKNLQCRWAQYKGTIETRIFAPFQLPDNDALHFYNGSIRFRPAAQFERQEHKMKLKPGPGVDNVGQMPIPQEALMKRGVTVKTDSYVNAKREKKAGKTKENGGKSSEI